MSVDQTKSLLYQEMNECITKCPVPSIPISESEPLTHGNQRIYLIRHGESVLNVPDSRGISYISGTSNHIPLTKKGQDEAKMLAEELAKKIALSEQVVICSSTAVRAKETANILFSELSAKFQCQKNDTDQFPDICEGGNGPWEGQPRDESWKQANDAYKGLSAKQKYITPELPGGENQKDGAERAISTFQEIFQRHQGKLVLVVTHGRIMRATTLALNGLVAKLSTKPSSELPTPQLENCDMLVIEKENPENKSMETARVIQQLRFKKN